MVIRLEKIRQPSKVESNTCLLFGASSQSQIDVSQFQRAKDVAGWSVAICRCEELEDNLFVTIERDGSINIRWLLSEVFGSVIVYRENERYSYRQQSLIGSVNIADAGDVTAPSNSSVTVLFQVPFAVS